MTLAAAMVPPRSGEKASRKTGYHGGAGTDAQLAEYALQVALDGVGRDTQATSKENIIN
jgi:hypothetical protein